MRNGTFQAEVNNRIQTLFFLRQYMETSLAAYCWISGLASSLNLAAFFCWAIKRMWGKQIFLSHT